MILKTDDGLCPGEEAWRRGVEKTGRRECHAWGGLSDAKKAVLEYEDRRTVARDRRRRNRAATLIPESCTHEEESNYSQIRSSFARETNIQSQIKYCLSVNVLYQAVHQCQWFITNSFMVRRVWLAALTAMMAVTWSRRYQQVARRCKREFPKASHESNNINSET